ncbi:glycosyltransferase involved in cell wall biosynthesis [Caldicoprobacter guelmensis]|uniref:glycosyltransferase family 4 protein n=1 Tax=Caldicoprobacter guelmensis TaxID=1170224 RepID=UPI00195BDC04|nr:glycosyltransferase family 4 protein [Caldicoprobacter guelmensis]MBM7581725.1 glycosyltransferase involved in cell wall biosynthesis [Caldicoprobacter guelmensis]
MGNSIICHITSAHPPYDDRIFHKECKTLAGNGYKVVLIAPHDKDEVVEGVKIKAIPKPKNRKERILKITLQVYKSALRENAEVYHFHDPELIPAGIMLRFHGKKVIYDVHEDVPRQIMSKEWIPKYLRGMVAGVMGMIEALASKIIDGIVAATPAIAKRFPKFKTTVVQNFPIVSEFVLGESIPYQNRPAKVVYIGGISIIRGIKEMIKAVELVAKKVDVRLVLAGSFSPPSLKDEIENLEGWQYVNFLGWQNRESIARLLGEARVGLVVLHPIPNYVEAWPVKLFEYMAVGLPVIVSDFPLWREIIECTGCGILVNPLKPKEIADAIKWILEHPEEAEKMGHRGREAVLNKYNWQVEGNKLLEFYRRILKEEVAV